MFKKSIFVLPQGNGLVHQQGIKITLHLAAVVDMVLKKLIQAVLGTAIVNNHEYDHQILITDTLISLTQFF